MFTKEDRSSFPYWFAHWCAFQMTALNNKCWKFKYLFHDIEKPFLKMIWDYKKVQKWHRFHNNHHIENYFYQMGKSKYRKCNFDWEATAIDWECSHYTKTSCPLLAKVTLEVEYEKLVSNENKYVNEIRKMYEIDDSRYYILVNNFYEKMSEKIKKIGLI